MRANDPPAAGQPEYLDGSGEGKPPPARQPFEPEMILIPAGEFLMGSDPEKDELAWQEEQPQHTLYLPDYYLGKTPVTNAQYAAFVEATGHTTLSHRQGGRLPPGREGHPVVMVSWPDAVAYCRWLSEVTGKPYCLPSEAEWEKGARGADGRIWPWGNDWDPKRCNSRKGSRGDTTPVGAYPAGASPYGLLDMAGNVLEWTRSLVGSYPYPSDKEARLERESLDVKDERRVLRGGAFYLYRRYVRCAFRLRDLPYEWSALVGFRVASSAWYSEP